jgi:hypothetical protein
MNGSEALGASPGRPMTAPNDEVSQRHWSVAEIATAWNLSEDSIRRLFANEPGVLVVGRQIKGSKRRYTTLRIPQSVVERVHSRYSFR